MDDATQKELSRIASYVCWWQKPEQTLANQCRFLNQAMVYGLHNDSLLVERVFGIDALQEAIEHAQPGLWDIASWRYWRLRLGLFPDAPLPERMLPGKSI
jgi:hypothetical protein